jgi:hypothetical protein
VLEFSNGVDTAAVVIAVDPGPLGVLNVSASDNVRIDTNRSAKPGEVLNVLATGLTQGAPCPMRCRCASISPEWNMLW